MLVKAELKNLGLHFILVELGEVDIMEDLRPEQRLQLKAALAMSGLELMDDQKAGLIEKIKKVVIEMVHYEDEMPKIKNSEYLSQKLHYDYTYLANLFSEVAGLTIEHYIIAHKIERVKELLMYDELNLTQISYKMNYSSVAHLSNQFKKVTGFTPTYYKQLKDKRRKSLEDVGSNEDLKQ
jgi:AraC-like DNA-binding protein